VPCKRRALCAFEFAYFARPDSFLVEDKAVYEIREQFGRNLGRCYADIMKKVDVILSVPETGDDAAYGLHEETGLRWERSNRRHRYVTRRAFIQLEKSRKETIDKKINVLSTINGKSVAVTEDSIVRGDTTKTIVEKMHNRGAREVHLFVTYPRIIGPCFYGIDMATYHELIGAKHSSEEIATIIGADSVNYQSLDDFVHATTIDKDDLCLGCLTGEYPTPLGQELADQGKEDFRRGMKKPNRLYE
jgi:amidophosphoribosyltransferase